MRNGLREYPTMIDPSLDLEATRERFGRARCVTAIKETRARNGRTIVYMEEQRESKEIVQTELGPRRKYEHGIIICGYKTRSWTLRKKVETLSPREKGRVIAHFNELSEEDRADYIDFWY